MSITDSEILGFAKEVLEIEEGSISAIKNRLDSSFVDAVFLILNTPGNVIFSGVGKSGHIARKLAATFASTGTPSYFVHPTEAAHGDLGMIRKEDLFVGISYSGESDELLKILPSIKRLGVNILAITGNKNSTLAKLSTITLLTSVEREACPYNLAPTASTTATLAIGDALAIACMRAKRFDAKDFAMTHPAGRLGKRLTLKVADVMKPAAECPLISEGASLMSGIISLTNSHLGSFVIVDRQYRPVGVYTEGDLARSLKKGIDFNITKAIDVATKTPKTINMNDLAWDALSRLKEFKINQLIVVDEEGKVVGILHVQNLLMLGLE